MSVLHARLRQANAGGSIRKRRFGTDDERNERERTNEEMSEAKRRRTQSVLCRGVGHGRAWIARRTSIGVPPRFSSQGVFHRKGLSLRPGFLGRGLSFERALPAPACPSPASSSRPSRTRGLMPKAARARVASPPAGTALASAIRDCLPNRVRLSEVRGYRYRYSITLSERATIAGGTVTPSASAVLRLIANSNLLGCSTGISVILTPRNSCTSWRA